MAAAVVVFGLPRGLSGSGWKPLFAWHVRARRLQPLFAWYVWARRLWPLFACRRV